jgi:manganese/iron transport system substrate-binding protein
MALSAGLAGVALAVGPAAAPSAPSAQERPVTLVATTTQLQDFARNVGGSRVDVVGLLKPNVDPHDYEPTPGDVTRVSEAKVVVEQGIGLDDWLGKVIDNAGGHPTVVLASRGVRVAKGDSEEPEGDPHIWFDPRNAVVMTNRIAAGLIRADPAGAATYRANAARYTARLRALDARLARRIATVPRARRKLVTNHDAFGYFARRYGITIVGAVVPSLSTAAEPSARQLAELVKTIKREGVKVIFTESSVDPKLERAIADEAGARVQASLFADTLGPEGSPGATYIGAMTYDMDEMVRGFTAR